MYIAWFVVGRIKDGRVNSEVYAANKHTASSRPSHHTSAAESEMRVQQNASRNKSRYALVSGSLLKDVQSTRPQ